VRVIGLVAILMGIAAAIVLWPRQEKEPPAPLMVVIPTGEPMGASEAMRFAVHEARRSFVKAHKGADVVLIEAPDEKMRAYGRMWRTPESKGEAKRGRGANQAGAATPKPRATPGVDLVIGAEAYLAQWARQGLLDSWDDFLEKRNLRLSSAALEGGRVNGTQRMLPLALDLPVIALGLPPELPAIMPSEIPQPDSLQALEDLAKRLGRGSDRPAMDAEWRDEQFEAVLFATAYAAGGAGQNAQMLLGRIPQALAWWRRGATEGWARIPEAEYEATPAKKPGSSAHEGSTVSWTRLSWMMQRQWLTLTYHGQMLLPPGASAKGTVCLVYGALLPEKSKNKELARAFAAELLSQKSQLALARRTGLLPALIGAWPKLKNAKWKALSAAAARSVAVPAELRSAETAAQFTMTVRRCISGDVSPEAAAAEIARLSGAAIPK
jgi:hypothetical protein